MSHLRPAPKFSRVSFESLDYTDGQSGFWLWHTRRFPFGTVVQFQPDPAYPETGTQIVFGNKGVSIPRPEYVFTGPFDNAGQACTWRKILEAKDKRIKEAS